MQISAVLLCCTAGIHEGKTHQWRLVPSWKKNLIILIFCAARSPGCERKKVTRGNLVKRKVLLESDSRSFFHRKSRYSTDNLLC